MGKLNLIMVVFILKKNNLNADRKAHFKGGFSNAYVELDNVLALKTPTVLVFSNILLFFHVNNHCLPLS